MKSEREKVQVKVSSGAPTANTLPTDADKEALDREIIRHGTTPDVVVVEPKDKDGLPAVPPITERGISRDNNF